MKAEHKVFSQHTMYLMKCFLSCQIDIQFHCQRELAPFDFVSLICYQPRFYEALLKDMYLHLPK